MKNLKTLLPALALTLFLTGAKAITFTTDTIIGAGDTTYDGQDITVSGCTLTVDGAHAFASLAVSTNSTLTHSPATTNQADCRLDITVTGDVTVQAGGAINVSGAGYAPDNGPGKGAGASYGGTGGGGGPVYGSMLQPVDAGSGGVYSSYWGGGSSGGGRVKLTVHGALTVNGSLLAAGANSGGNAGSGGSLWLAVGQLAGGGVISANGGNGNGGGGGGGRIAIYYDANAFSGMLTAFGGGGARGGPGTILLKANAAAAAFLELDNGGTAGAWTPLDLPQAMDVLIAQGAQMYPTVPQTFNSLHIASGGYLIHAVTYSNLNATVLGDATVDAGGYVYATGQGFPNDTGPGAGPGSPGSHGGQGAFNSGPTYDSILEPTWKGSGGSYGNYWGPGSAGGGVVRMIVNGTLTVNGAMEANGLVAAGAGGAGGAVWLTVGKLAGGGSITANGGNGNGGGGGGGRIAIYLRTNEFSGPVTAFSGSAYNANGGPGTVFTKTIGASVGSLVLDNNGQSGKWTPLAVPELMHVRLTNGANIYPSEAITFQSLLVQSNGWLIQNADYGLTNIQITVMDDATVDLGGVLWADGQGYPADQGPGRYPAAGGSHGGVGGAGTGLIYDSLLQPTWRGSGGSYGSYWGVSQPGGGAFRLIVNGTFTLNGQFTANGLNGATGGGAGGSLWLTVGELAGAGVICANGGMAYGGGGGGGRIAIYTATNDFTGLITAYGGSCSSGHGGPGTVFIQVIGQPFGRLVLDNNGLLGTWTPLALPELMHVRLARGAQMYPTSPQTCQSLLVQSNAWIIHKAEFANLDVTVREDATFEAGTGLWADGQGYPADVSYEGATGPVGGSHGGLGGGAGVRDYDAVDQPALKGSGGGYGSYWGVGAAGGGALKFTVNGRLTVDGICTANGLNGATGGGAGGSVWLTVGELAGAGVICANGGTAYGGGGGGGRLAIYFTTNSFAGTVTAYGRGAAGGAGTIYWKAASASAGTVWLDNAGAAGNYTPLDASVRYHLEMSNAVSVITRQPLLLVSLHMASNTWMTHLQTGPPLAVDVTVLGDAVVDAGAEISANGRGYPADTGPGELNGGGSYGGRGGGDSGPTYGSESAPTDWGSGGSYNSYWGVGAAGAGALRLSVGGALTFNGRASVNGFNASGGGGAGGSIWLTVAKLTGNGTLTANGGSGYSASGGGGRIAIISPDPAVFAGSVLALAGGADAGAGTVFYAASPAALTVSQQTPVGTVVRTVAYVDITFTNALDPASFTTADVSFTTPTGAVATAALTVTPVGGAIYRLGFPTQATLGGYQFTVGPGIRDLFGQTMASAYHGTFAIAQPVISGTITNSAGVAVPGVLLSASDGHSVTSGAAGEYNLAVTPGFTGTITPSKSGWVFVPGRRSHANVSANSSDQNFLAVLGSLTTTLTMAKDGNNLVLSWLTYAGARYQLQAATNLPAASWLDKGAPFPGTGGLLSTSLPIGPEPNQFFRLQIQN